MTTLAPLIHDILALEAEDAARNARDVDSTPGEPATEDAIRAAEEARGPFGRVTPNDGATSYSPTPAIALRRPGQIADATSGLYQNRHRYFAPAHGAYTQADPLTFEGWRLPAYTYVSSSPLAGVDPSGLLTAVLVTYDYGVGSHAGLYVSNSGDPIVYDPAGGYHETTRGSGDAVIGPDADFMQYLTYERGHADRVEVYPFDTTPEQEAKIVANIGKIGGQWGGFCAAAVCDSIRGVGPFGDLEGIWFPGSLADELDDLYWKQNECR